MSTVSTTLNFILGLPINVIRQEEELISMQIGKERMKQPLFTDEMTARLLENLT